MPSSKPSPFSFIDIDELREELNFMVNDIYSKLDYALNLDGKGIMIGLKFGGMGQDITAWDGLVYIAGGASGNLTLGTGLVFDSATGKLYLNVTTKGDLLAATGDQAMALLPIGTAGQVLSVGGAHATGLQWASAVLDTLFDANTILKADSDNTPIALTVGEQTLVGRITGGVITALSTTQVRTLINVENASVALATVKADADIASAISLQHARSHAITGTSDHSSAATPGRMLKADANGLPIDATNTDAAVAAAVTASHSNALDHTQGTDTALGVLGTKNPPIDADKAIYRDSTAADALVTSTWTQVKAFLKTYFDAIYHIVGGALGTPSSGTLTSCTGLPQAGVVGLTTADSPVFVTVKLSGLTDLKVPKHVADATGLADTTITVTANNEVTNASQPAFLARPTATLLNVTGDGTTYTVVFATEVFDQNADFDGTSTFTAPVAGRYLLSFNLYILGLAAGHNSQQTGLVTSNRGFWFDQEFAAGANPFTFSDRGETVLVDMDAADTAYVTYTVAGGGLAVDLGTQSYFSGHLVC